MLQDLVAFNDSVLARYERQRLVFWANVRSWLALVLSLVALVLACL